MKDIDDMLRESTPTPKRELSANFTQEIIAEIKTNPTQKPASNKFWSSIASGHKRMATALTAMLAVLVLSGSVYAAPQVIKFVNAFIAGETKQADGSRIVAINMHDCGVATNLEDVTPSETWYYWVNKDAPISNDDVAQIVQAECELSTLEDYVVVPQEYIDAGNSYTEGALNSRSTEFDSNIDAISSTTLTVTTKEQMYGQQGLEYYENRTRTFGAIADDVQVYSTTGDRIPLSDVVPGDHVKVTYITPSAPSASQPNDDANSIVIGIQKTSVNITQARAFVTYNNDYFYRVEPCDTDESGYCKAEQLSSQAELDAPSDFNLYIKESDAINAIKPLYELYLSGESESSIDAFKQLAAQPLLNAMDEKPISTLFCMGAAPSRLSYGVVGVDEKGDVLISAGDHFTVLDENKPTAIVHYNVEAKQITEIQCVDTATELQMYQDYSN